MPADAGNEKRENLAYPFPPSLDSCVEITPRSSRYCSDGERDDRQFDETLLNVRIILPERIAIRSLIF